MRVADPVRLAAIATAAGVALAVVLLPWYSLDDYVPNGWDATWWARVAALLAIANVVALRIEAPAAAVAGVAALIALLVAVRVALPPDFGFDFDGLEVPVERSAGCWVALAMALAHLASAARLALARPAAPDAAAAGP